MTTTECFICGETPSVDTDKNSTDFSGRENPSTFLLCQILNLTQVDSSCHQQLSQVSYCFQCLDKIDRTRLILEELRVLEKELLDYKYDLETKFLQNYDQIRQNQNDTESGSVNELKLKIGRDVKEGGLLTSFKKVLNKQPRGVRKRARDFEEIVPETIVNDSVEDEVHNPNRHFQQDIEDSYQVGDSSNEVDQEPGCSNLSYDYQSDTPVAIKVEPYVDLTGQSDEMNESDYQEEYSHEIFGVIDSPDDNGMNVEYVSNPTGVFIDVASGGETRTAFARGVVPFPQKKSVTGYIVYASEVRKHVTAKNPAASFGEISRTVGIDWRKLPPAEKLVYQEKADQINEKKRIAWEGSAQEISKPILDIRTRTLLLKKDTHWIFECGWAGCEWQFEDALDLIEHCVQEPNGHVPTVFKFSDPNNGEFHCCWKNCGRVGKAPFPSLLRLLKHVKEIHIFKGNGRIVLPAYRNEKIILCKDPERRQPMSLAMRRKLRI